MQKKHLPEYLLEFFMIFLAVFLGFVAENIREQHIERQKEKEYIRSMINDIKTDTTKLGLLSLRYQRILAQQDTLLRTYRLLEKGFSQVFQRNFNGILGFPDFIYTDATIQQLKNSGGFRLIRDRSVIDSIMAYDALVKSALINEELLNKMFGRILEDKDAMFDFQRFEELLDEGKSLSQLESSGFCYLLTRDPAERARFYNNIQDFKWLSEIVKANMGGVKLRATRLIRFLESEYDF